MNHQQFIINNHKIKAYKRRVRECSRILKNRYKQKKLLEIEIIQIEGEKLRTQDFIKELNEKNKKWEKIGDVSL